MSQPLFDAAKEIGARVRQAPRHLLCLDFDGTLSHFVDDPAAAHLSPAMERALRSLAGLDTMSIAIVSGRERTDLHRLIDIPGLIYVGNHGLDIGGPGYVFVEPTAASRTEELRTLAQTLTAKLQAIEGTIVEYKGLTISIHYRQVAPTAREEVRRIVHDTLAAASHPFVLSAGEKVHEIRPRVYWNKGTAVNWIRTQLGKPEALPIYVGDDATDEDAFTAIRDVGITVKVRSGPETAANYTLEGPAEVRRFLEWLDQLLRHRTTL
jgi:trehalose 6-phosphate phosphatase